MAQVGYIRVSTVEQKGDRQLANVELDKIFEDKASGGNTKRPGLQACLDYLREGDTLHVHSIDRLARNLAELQEMVNGLVKEGITIVFHKENLIFTPDKANNPCQELMLQMLGAFAQFELSLIRERQAEGIAAAKAKGVKFGRPGLDDDLVAAIKERLAAGIPIAHIAKELGVTRPTVYKYAPETGHNSTRI